MAAALPAHGRHVPEPEAAAGLSTGWGSPEIVEACSNAEGELCERHDWAANAASNPT